MALLDDGTFLAAAATVGAAVAAGAAVGSVGVGRWLPPAGPAVLVAVLLGSALREGSPLGSILLVLAAGALACAPGRGRFEWVVAASVLAALLTAVVADPVSGWEVALVVVAGAVAMASVVAALHLPPGRLPVTWSLAAVTCGVFLCVPETDQARLVAGAMAVALAGVVAGVLRPIGRVGAGALVCLSCWIAMTEGAARAGSVVGAGACVLALGLLPLSDRLAAGRRLPGWSTPAVLAVVVAVCSRVAGLRHGADGAAVIAAAALAAGVAALWCVTRLVPEPAAPLGLAAGVGDDDPDDRRDDEPFPLTPCR